MKVVNKSHDLPQIRQKHKRNRMNEYKMKLKLKKTKESRKNTHKYTLATNSVE